MPTLANQLASGSGVFRARLVIAGWPTIYVDSDSLEGVLADGRQQLLGLDPLGLRIAATAQIELADLQEQGATIELTDDWQHAISASVATVPSALTWLTGNLATSGTTITVASTDGFASSGTVHIGDEAIAYTGKTSTTFTGCTRGTWDTTALAHFTGDGETTTYPRVTNRPETMRGRRCSVYLYGSADSDSGGGTERWRGVVRDDPEYSLGRWTMGIEPRSWILDQQVGGEIVDGVPLRGIYIPASGALRFDLVLLTNENASATVLQDARIALSGFFETQQAFCTALDAVINTATTGWSWDAGSEIRAEPIGNDGWRLSYRTGSTTSRYVVVRTVGLFARTGGMLSPVDVLASGWYSLGSPGLSISAVAAGGVYYIDVSAPVPRAAVGDHTLLRTQFYDASRPQWASNRIYLGGRVVPASWMAVQIDPGVDGSDPGPSVSAVAVDTTNRFLSLAYVTPLALGPRARLNLLRAIRVDGTVAGLIASLIADSPGLVATGVLPLVTTSDFSTDFSEAEAAVAGYSLARRTWWAGGTSQTLRDLLIPELRAAGLYLAPSSTGQLTLRRLRPPLRTDPRAGTLDSDVIGGPPALSLSPFGHLREVVYRLGWDQREGEWIAPSIRVRTLAVSSSVGGALEVAQRSTVSGTTVDLPELTVEQAYLLASSVIGMFSRPYRVVTLPDVSIAMIDSCQIGSVVVVESDELPASDGTWGIDQVGLVIGYDWSPYEGKGNVSVLLQDLSVGGYSPGFIVASESGSGTTWDLTLTLAPHTTEDDIATWLQVGDEIRLIERDSTAPTIVAGTVASIDSATVIGVEMDSTWTPGASEWILDYDTSALIDETRGARGWAQTDFALIAGSDRRVALGSGDADAREFAG